MSKPLNHRAARRSPEEGDVVAAWLPERGWIFGRVVSTEAHADPHGAWTGLPLLYIFRHIRPEPKPPRPLLSDDLLFAPLVVDGEPWARGFLGLVEHRSFEPGERLAVHCFENHTFTTPKYFDEFGNQLHERKEPCGIQGLHTLQGLEKLIRSHLGLPYPGQGNSRVFAGRPPAGTQYCVTVYLPPDETGALDPAGIERDLTEAVESARAGEWEGHGTELETGMFDIRFLGRSVERMLNAMRPVLRRYERSLPPGWYLTEHSAYTDARRINLD